jgi:hypothetical protein
MMAIIYPQSGFEWWVSVTTTAVERSLAQRGPGSYTWGMPNRLIHDASFEIASALTKEMVSRLAPGEESEFHRVVYETCKAGIERYTKERDREAKRLRPLGRG